MSFLNARGSPGLEKETARGGARADLRVEVWALAQGLFIGVEKFPAKGLIGPAPGNDTRTATALCGGGPWPFFRAAGRRPGSMTRTFLSASQSAAASSAATRSRMSEASMRSSEERRRQGAVLCRWRCQGFSVGLRPGRRQAVRLVFLTEAGSSQARGPRRPAELKEVNRALPQAGDWYVQSSPEAVLTDH